MKKFISTLMAFTVFGAGASHASLDNYFVSTEWLVENRDQVLVIDVRRAPLYWLGHIDGAQHVDRDYFLETRNQVVSLVPGLEAMKNLLGELGATQDTPVVVYAEDDNPYAARLVWTLHYHGHTNSYVLDGGYQKWSRESHPISRLSSRQPEPVEYVLATNTKYLEARAEADYIQTRIGHPGAVIWDTRSAGEYAGSDVRANRGGHIPGAVHLNWTDLQHEVNGVKVLKPQDEIVALLNASGLTPDKEILAHCQTGIRSSYATLVLAGLGYERIKNYDGSWIEWANNPALPIIAADGSLDSSVQISDQPKSGLFRR